ncbi:MAG: hypothetical protein V3U67_04525 [Gemmatimonadota bacterium]
MIRRSGVRDRLWPILLVLTASCYLNPPVEDAPALGPDNDADAGPVVEAEPILPVVGADSTSAQNERALYEGALVQADPQADTYDPNQARADLATLLGLYPEGEYAESARLLSHLLIEVRRLGLSTVRLADRVQELEEKLEGVRQIDLEGTSP